MHELTAAHTELNSALLLAAQRVAEQEGLAEHGYRVVTNVGIGVARRGASAFSRAGWPAA